MPNFQFIQGDFMDDAVYAELLALCSDGIDVVMSDMAANTTGHTQTDHLRTMALCEAAADFAFSVLKPGGHFLAKVFRGGTEGELLKLLKRRFDSVKHFKPESSRKGSTEMYVVAMGLREE